MRRVVGGPNMKLSIVHQSQNVEGDRLGNDQTRIALQGNNTDGS